MAHQGRVTLTDGPNGEIRVRFPYGLPEGIGVTEQVFVSQAPRDPDEAWQAANDALRSLLSFYAVAGNSAREIQRITSCINLIERETT